MKIVCIIGSKNSNSCTERIFDKIFENLKKHGDYDLEKVILRKQQLLDCLGCNMCFKEGVCSLDKQDNFGMIRDTLEKADIIFFTSPVYVHNVTGVMKTFLDRLAKDMHLMKFAGKFGFTLTTTSRTGGDYVKEYMGNMQRHLGIKNLENYLYIKSSEKSEDFFARETAGNIIHELKMNKTFSSQEFEDFFRRYKYHFTKGYASEFERRYWSQDWIKECDTFYEFANRNREQLHLEKIKKKVNTNKILNFWEEKIPLSPIQRSKAIQIVENYFKVYLEGKLAPKYYLDFLLVLIESYTMLEEKEKWEEVGYRLCAEIKEGIERNGVPENFMGMIGGFGNQAFLVEQYKNTTGNLQGFSKSLNKLFLECAYKKAKKFLETNKSVNMKDYDSIYGLSGNVYYLLDLEWSTQEKEKINLILEYLINLTRYHKYKNQDVLNFHITKEEQLRLDEKETFPDGNFNFGISHGMLGPLIALSKAYSLGYSLIGLNKAIDELFSIYEVFKKYSDGIPIWPTQLSYEDYINKTFTYGIREIRASWCYGNIGIARGLYKSAKYINDPKRMLIYENDLKKALNRELEQYNLGTVVLCHGYSSVLAVQIAAYWSTKDKDFLKNKNQNLNKILSMCLSEDNPKNINTYLHTNFQDNMSLLQGAAGVVLSILSLFRDNMIYKQLLMID